MAKKARDIPWLDQIGGVYYVFWYDKERRRTRRLSLGTAEAGEAQARYAAFLVEHGRIDKVIEAGQGIPSVSVVLDIYAQEHVPESPETQAIALGYLRVHFGALPFTSIDSQAVGWGLAEKNPASYCERRMAGTLGWTDVDGKRRGYRKAGSTGTLRRELTVLIAAINHYLRKKKLPENLAPVFNWPPDSEPKERWLTHDELTKLIAAAKGRTRRFIRLAYYTAARKEALETLTKFQVDLGNRRIRLNPPGRKQTKKRRPTVPIFDEIIPDLEAAMKEPGELVLGPGSIRKGFDLAVQRAGLEGVTPHTLRHTRATHLLRAGTDPWVVAGLLGDRIETVMKTYGHHCPDHIREAVERRLRGEDALGATMGVTPKTTV